MAALLTCRHIPVPEWVQPVVQRAQQPPVPPPQGGTYGNAAMTQAAHNVEAPAHYWSSSNTASRPGDFHPSTLPWREAYPQYCSELPWRYRQPRYPGLASASIRTQPRPQDTSRATEALLPSGANPQSRLQELAAKRAAPPYPPTPQDCPDSTSAPLKGARARDRGNPAPSTEREITEHHTTAATQPDAGARNEGPPWHHASAKNGHPKHHETPRPSQPNICPRAASPPDPSAG